MNGGDSGLRHGKSEESNRDAKEVAAMALFISISIVTASMYLTECMPGSLLNFNVDYLLMTTL